MWPVTVVLYGMCVIVMWDLCVHGLGLVGMGGGVEMLVLAGVEEQG